MATVIPGLAGSVAVLVHVPISVSAVVELKFSPQNSEGKIGIISNII